MEEILKALKTLPKEYLQVIILELMKDRDKNLKNIMHYLLDKGRINTTHEMIDSK